MVGVREGARVRVGIRVAVAVRVGVGLGPAVAVLFNQAVIVRVGFPAGAAVFEGSTSVSISTVNRGFDVSEGVSETEGGIKRVAARVGGGNAPDDGNAQEVSAPSRNTMAHALLTSLTHILKNPEERERTFSGLFWLHRTLFIM